MQLFISSTSCSVRATPLIGETTGEGAGTDHQRSQRKGWPGRVPGTSQAKSFLYPEASFPGVFGLLTKSSANCSEGKKPLPFIMDLGINEDCS